MAEYKWEVDNNQLILKEGDANVATISGGLISQLTANGQTFTTEQLNKFLTFTPYQATVEASQGVAAQAEVIGKITLKEAAIAKGSATATITLTSVTDGQYTLGLEGADATSGELKLGDAEAEKWETSKNSDTTTANHFSAGTPTTYKLAGNTITYTPASKQETADIIITGLKDMQGTELKPLITITEKTGAETEGTITIAASALPEGGDKSLTVTLTTGATDYNLKLDSNATKFDTAESTPKITSVTGGKATIKRTQSAGWSEGETPSDTLTYTLKTDKTLATVEGLSADIKAGEGANAGKFGTEVEGTFVEAITVSSTTVTVAKNALQSVENTKVEAKKDNDNNEAAYQTFTLALKDATNKKLGFEHIDPYWTLNSTTATYNDGTKEGWTLVTDENSENKGKITYTKQVDNTLATISNLNSNVTLGGEKLITVNNVDGYSKIGTKEGTVFTEGITVNETAGTFTLTKDVLTNTANTTESITDNSTTLAQGTKLKADGTAGGEVTTYKLALGTGATAPGTTAENPHLTEITTESGVKQTTVEGTKAAGWTLDQDGLKISYTAATPVTLATISGLADGATIKDTVTNGEVTKAADVKIVDNTIVLTAAAIGPTKKVNETDTNCEVTLTNENGGAYTIARAEGVTAPGTTPSTFTLELSGESKQLKTVTVKGAKAPGYVIADVESGGTKTGEKITYSAPEAESLATITNLNKNVVTSNNADTLGQIGINPGDSYPFVEGIKLDKDTGTILLQEAVLTDAEDKVMVLTPTEKATTYNLTFKLALADGIKAPATEVTGQKLDITNSSVQDNGELKIVGTLEKGWVLSTEGADANKKITYTAEKTPTLATIKGLKKDGVVNTNITLDTTNEATKGTIKLFKNALKTEDNSTVTIELATLDTGVTDSLRESYKFALADDVAAPGKEVNGNPVLTFPKDTDGTTLKPDGTATLVGTKSAGWVLDRETNIVTRKPAEEGQVVAEITGLSLDANSTNVTLSDNVVTLKKGSLTNEDVVITDKTTDTKYTLALGDDLPNLNTLKSKAGGETLNYWEKSGTTAKYYENKKESWLLKTDEDSKRIAYAGQTQATLLATITNLNPAFTLGSTETDTAGIVRAKSIGTGTYKASPDSGDYVAGVSVTDTNSDEKYDTITLSKNVLGTTAGKPMELTTTTDGNALTLALDARTETQYADLKVPKQATDANVWELGATSKYKAVETAFWTLDDETNSATKGKKITYTAQTAGTLLATITGLNPDVTEDDLNITAHQTGGTQEAPTTTKDTIKLNAQALNKRDVTITSDYYTLTLNTDAGKTLADLNKKVDEPTLTNAKWDLNDAHTIATYTAKVTEGYEATSDGSSVKYTAAADNKEIAKVTGLNGDSKLGVSGDGQKIGIVNGSSVSDGLTLASKVITLTKDVLGTSNVAVTGTNYTLALGSDITTANTGTATLNAQGNVTIKAPAEQTVWRVSNGANNTATATYKKVIPYYYTVGVGATAITYTPEATAKTNTGTEQAPVYKDAIIATVTGLKRGLTVASDGQSLKGTDENGDPATGVLTLNSKAVTLTKDALGTSNVEVKEGDLAGTDKYTLALSTVSGQEPPAPTDGSTFTWSVSSTTATLKGTATAGYTLDTVANSETKDKKIIYTPANANKTFATLTGLKSGITASELNTTDSDKPIDIATDIATKVLKLDKRVLGEGNVTLDEAGITAGYTLALDMDSNSYAPEASTSKKNKIWLLSGTTATYNDVTEAYYKVEKQTGTTTDNQITYVPRVVPTTPLATVTGLKNNLKVENDKIEGITLGNLNEGTFTPNDSGTVIQLSKDVLGTTEAAIGQGSYTLALADGVAPEQDGETFWTVSGTNASYQFKQTAGHTLDSTSKKATYSQAGTKTYVTIEGLKNGIKKTDVEAGIAVSTDNKTYTMSKNVLGTAATTTLKNGDVESAADFAANYKFALAKATDDAPATPTSNQVGWVKDGSNFILKSFTTPGYKIATDANPKTITYTSWADEKDLATVTGLNTKAKLDTDTRQIEGIDLTELAATGTHTVTLNDASVFSGKSVEIKKATNAAAEYTLAVDNSQNPKYSYEWTFKKGTKNGTATLTETMSAGYTLDNTAGSETLGHIVYYPKETVTTTIAGLNNNVEVSKTADGTNGNSIGIKGGTADNPTYSGITFNNDSVTAIPISGGAITLGANVLAGANVTLTNKSGGGKYTLALDGTTVTEANVDTARWFKSNNTTAVYQTVTQQGYKKTDDTKITYYSDASGTPTTLATLKGLKNGFTAEQLNDINILAKTEPTTQSSSPNVTGNNDDPEPTATTTTTPGNFTIKSNAILTNTTLTLTGNTDEYKDYQLLLEDDDSLKVTTIANENATWKFNKGTANLVVGKTEGWSNKVTNAGKTTEKIDYKTIVYTKEAPVTIATVSGLATTDVTVSADDKSLVDKDGKDIVVYNFTTKTEGEGANATTTAVGTITLSKNALTNKNVTVTIPKNITGYTFELATDGDVFEPIPGDKYWTADGKGKAVYQYDTAAGYNLNEAKTTLTYSKEKPTTLATITGLATAAIARKDTSKTAVNEIKKDAKAAELDGITVSSDPTEVTTGEGANATTKTEPGVITLWKSSVLGNKVTVTGDYKFVLDNEQMDVVTEGGSKWYFSGGTATYKGYKTAGYEFATTKTGTNDKVVNYKAETAGDTLVTIKGLAKKIGNDNITADMVNNDNLLVVNEDRTVTISKDITGTSTITLVNGVETPKNGSTPATYYDYQIDTTNSTYTTRVTDAPVWTFSKGTATLKQKTSAGFALDELGENGQQKLTYSKEANPVVATVKGLSTNLAVATEDNIPTSGTKKVGKIYAATTTGTGRNAVTTITGTKEALSYDANEKIITINSDALTTKNVTLTTSKTDGYKLAIGTGIVNAAVNTNGWVVSGTTANYKNYDTAFYALSNEKTIKYTAATKGTIYATVTGLKKDTTIAAGAWSGDKDGGILTLTADNLGTSTVKITSKVAGNDKFLLKLASDNETQAELSALTVNTSVTADNGGKAVIKGTLGVGFTQEFGGKTLTYNKTANKSVTIATVTGLKKGASVSVDDSTGQITLDAEDLNDKNVSVTTSWGDTIYKLNYSPTAPGKDITNTVEIGAGQEDAPANPKNKTPGWTISGTTGTLKGYVTSAGYTKSESDTSLTYTGETLVNTTKDKTTKKITDYIYKDTTTLATIKGLKTTADKSKLISSNTINLKKDNTNGNLTLTGGTYAVSVAADYTGKSITGSAGADDITAEGTKLVITGGKGDDKITLGTGRTSSTANTLVYSNGDGNDVVANFTANDKLQVKSGAVSVGKVGDDVVVKVGAGSINLGSYTGDTIDIYNAKNVKTTYAIAGAYTGTTSSGNGNILLEDNNYSMDAANLSSLVQGDSASYTPYDFSSSFSLTKEDKLTPQISYSGTSDKK